MKRGILALIALVILISACDNGEEDVQGASVFKGGTQGIAAEFEPFGILEDGTPTIYDTEKFPIEVTLRNKGEEDVAVGKATVRIKGVNLVDFEGIIAENLSNTQNIEKVSEYYLDGGETIIDFTPNGGAKYKINITGFFSPEIFADITYRYKTKIIIPEVCFNEDASNEEICKVKEQKTVYVSGAPITVTNVEEDVAGKGLIVLFISIDNVGGGKVTLPGEEFKKYNQLAIKKITSPESWDCRGPGGENLARLTDGKATVICKLNQQLAEDVSYIKQMELELEYDYQTLISEKIQIKESID